MENHLFHQLCNLHWISGLAESRAEWPSVSPDPTPLPAPWTEVSSKWALSSAKSLALLCPCSAVNIYQHLS